MKKATPHVSSGARTSPLEASVSRRQLLLGTLALGAGSLVVLARGSAATQGAAPAGGKVKIEAFSAAGKSQGVTEVARVVKTDDGAVPTSRKHTLHHLRTGQLPIVPDRRPTHVQ